ncbi:MAG TPA: FxLYD domain-containing protein, partial [Candidatus Limnocylindrales bacterium]|nr:FxLYD domain-containing protein [Candidatus Limnocylindrales bacterium]
MLLLGAALLLGACSGGGAVVFAPTPLPPDESPLAYTHPSGAFSLDAPRRWSLHEQYTSQLATAAFTPPGGDEPLIMTSAVNLGDEAESAAFSDLITRYQTQARPDLEDYIETGREPMPDGSWRISGYRTLPGGRQQPVNTFIELDGPLMAVTEVLLPGDPAVTAALEAAANSLRLTPPGSLSPADLSAFTYARAADLSVVHIHAWTTPEGVFYVTGELANSGVTAVASVPIEVTLLTADGTPLTGAVDRTMGHAIPAGGFAPFSLRFGGGQPDLARGFSVRAGGGTAEPDAVVAGAESLAWTDSATFEDANLLTVSGDVTNTGTDYVRGLRAIATVFDAAQNVIGAAYADLQPPTLAPGESAPYRFVFT